MLERNYDDPLQAAGLLMIDEIDLHLHPVWQRNLVSFLKETLPNFQVIATTHSPLTVHQAGEGELYVLRRDPKRRSSRLYPFNGVPNRMLLHQLIQSPIFGLETLDSPEVQSMRKELRGLKKTKGARSSKRIAELRAELSRTPSWEEVPHYLQPTNALLKRIATDLSDRSGSDAAGRAVRTIAGKRASGSSAKATGRNGAAKKSASRKVASKSGASGSGGTKSSAKKSKKVVAKKKRK